MSRITLNLALMCVLHGATYLRAEDTDDVYFEVAAALVPALGGELTAPPFAMRAYENSSFLSDAGRFQARKAYEAFVDQMSLQIKDAEKRRGFVRFALSHQSDRLEKNDLATSYFDIDSGKIVVAINPELQHTWFDYLLKLRELQRYTDFLESGIATMRRPVLNDGGVNPYHLAVYFLTERRAMAIEWLYLQTIPVNQLAPFESWLAKHQLRRLQLAEIFWDAHRAKEESLAQYLGRQYSRGRHNVEAAADVASRLNVRPVEIRYPLIDCEPYFFP
jgi:hypothetical protein